MSATYVASSDECEIPISRDSFVEIKAVENRDVFRDRLFDTLEYYRATFRRHDENCNRRK